MRCAEAPVNLFTGALSQVPVAPAAYHLAAGFERPGREAAMSNAEPHWRRSTYCDTSACVEVARASEHVSVRDSKDPEGPVLTFPNAEWAQFIRAIGRGPAR